MPSRADRARRHPRSRASVAFGCRGGGCGTCKMRVVAGQVDHGRCSTAVLPEEERTAGWFLSCQACARSDLTVELTAGNRYRVRPGSAGWPARLLILAWGHRDALSPVLHGESRGRGGTSARASLPAPAARGGIFQLQNLSLAKTSSASGDEGPMLPEKLRKASRFWAGAIGGRAVGSWGGAPPRERASGLYGSRELVRPPQAARLT